jgi:hypothetical protein
MTREEARLVEQLLEHAVEMHSREMNDFHAGDAEHRGLAPEACSYCETFEQVANSLGINLRANLEAITAAN